MRNLQACLEFRSIKSRAITGRSPSKSTRCLNSEPAVFLTIPEHAVVTAAANIKGMNVGDYMKMAVIEQAKKHAKELNKIIDSI